VCVVGLNVWAVGLDVWWVRLNVWVVGLNVWWVGLNVRVVGLDVCLVGGWGRLGETCVVRTRCLYLCSGWRCGVVLVQRGVVSLVQCSELFPCGAFFSFFMISKLQSRSGML